MASKRARELRDRVLQRALECAGWVSITFGAKPPPVGVLLDWLEESYRAVAPKRLSKMLD